MYLDNRIPPVSTSIASQIYNVHLVQTTEIHQNAISIVSLLSSSLYKTIQCYAWQNHNVNNYIK